ncbi:uncharacterized protein BX663DRAFT_492997 [Cokeromyces recurvatus]|uniref:uncharacterized protein n=1 Tax=Cokeromyces recurvatus TaxID=90255 RepID=UPI00221E79A5|nr:uncharacterized protein BX663DRAFT_492997 [Cokeromyces recurvatus]KAI7908106.1 hypothetical protein BX663DRAFT_492997 [Cokeromyces recurvatus]
MHYNNKYIEFKSGCSAYLTIANIKLYEIYLYSLVLQTSSWHIFVPLLLMTVYSYSFITDINPIFFYTL